MERRCRRRCRRRGVQWSGRCILSLSHPHATTPPMRGVSSPNRADAVGTRRRHTASPENGMTRPGPNERPSSHTGSHPRVRAGAVLSPEGGNQRKCEQTACIKRRCRCLQWRQEQNLHGLVSGELACVCRTASFRQRRTLALGSRCDSRDFGPLRLILHAVPGPARRGRALALVLFATCSLLCRFLSLLLALRCTGTTPPSPGSPSAVKKGEARSARGRAR